ncbi:MAG: FtsX-like permease family protein [Candidatus Caenarcaniphilales bacterium]|nr:FtsX-like permease family protein [Candidatus Caenarcaniphilales bacterium]
MGVALVVSIFNANESIIEQFNYSNKLIRGKSSAKIVNKNNFIFSQNSLSTELLKQLRNFDYTPVLEIKAFDTKTKQTIKILGIDFLNDYRFRDYDLVRKNQFFTIKELIDSKKGGLLISELTKRKLNWLSPNQMILYGDREIPISLNEKATLKDIGIVKAEGGLIALGDIEYVQKIFNEEKKFSSLEFKDISPKELKEQLRLPESFEIVDPSRKKEEISNLTSAFRFNLQALSFIALLVAAYLISQTVLISFQRKTKVIGILRVLGFSRKQTFNMLLLESFLIGLIGVIIGSLIGIILSKSILGVLQTTVNELYFSVTSTDLITSPKGILVGSFVGLTASLVSGLPSSFLSLRVEPIVNLRSNSFKNIDFVSPRKIWGICLSGLFILLIIFAFQQNLFSLNNRYSGFIIAFWTLIGLSLIAGFFLYLALLSFSKGSNWFTKLISIRLSSNFIRLWIATGALICGLSMTISINLMIDSFRDTVADWINHTLKGDIYLSSIYKNPVGINPQIIKTAESWTEIEAVDFLSKHKTKINNKPCTVGGANIGLQLEQLKLTETAIDYKNKLLFGANYVLVSNTFALKHNLIAGDTLNIPTNNGLKEMIVAGIYQDYSSEHGYVLMRRKLYLNLFDNPKISNIAFHLREKDDLDLVKTRLFQLDKSILNVNALKIQTNSQLRESILEIFNQTFQISYLFFWIALFISITTVSLTLFSCIEENEYLNLVGKYLGTTNNQIRLMEITQGLLITFLAIVLSVPGGYWLSYILQNTVNNNSFGWIIYLHPNWLSISIISILSLWGALIGSIIPLIKASKMKVLKNA